jgi:amino acid transporter
MSWISGPSRGLLWTAQEGEIPPFLAKTNKHGVQITILMIQGVIVTVLALAYFVMADVSVAFFLLSAMTITLYLIMYMLMYAAAIRLRYSQPELKRSYSVPGGIGGMWLVAGVGFAGVVFAFIVGFFPPSQLPVGSPTLYVGLVVGGTILFTGLPLLISSFKQASWRASAAAPVGKVVPGAAE